MKSSPILNGKIDDVDDFVAVRASAFIPGHRRPALRTRWTGGKDRTISSKSDQSLGRLRYLLFSIAIGLGFVHAWVGRAVLHDIDGISYLDMGDAYLRGDWTTAVNGLWSPLYALFLGGALRVMKPSASWEFPLVHMVGFAIYVGASLSFDFLWIELGHVLRERSTSQEESRATFPEWAWLLLGYCLFLWVSLQLISVVEETPDMLVAAAVYIASALLLRMSRNHARIGTFFVLGLVLGLGYLAKTILFPLSFVFLAVAAFMTYKRRESLARPLVAVLVFLLTASPLLVVLSRAKGRLTFGDSGRINYIWHVDGVPRMYWQGDYPGSGIPIHPPRLILAKPAVYEFAAPFAATFPPWYDPSYWYEGMHPHFDLRKQVRALVVGAGIYHGLFLKSGAALVTISLTLLFLGGSMRDISGRLDVLLPAMAGLGLYALVHVEPRYVGSFILVFWGGVLSQLRLPKSELSSRLLRAATLAIVAIYSTELCVGALGAAATERDLAAGAQEELQIAQGIRQAGLRPGDRVATVGGMGAMVWARLAKVRIVANLPDDTDFWFQGDDTRSRTLSAFAATGAKAIVAASPSGAKDGWIKIGQTEYYLYALTDLK